MNGNAIKWSTLAQIVVPILLAALLAVIGFLFKEVSDLKAVELTHYGELKADLVKLEFIQKSILDRVNAITVVKVKEVADASPEFNLGAYVNNAGLVYRYRDGAQQGDQSRTGSLPGGSEFAVVRLPE